MSEISKLSFHTLKEYGFQCCNDGERVIKLFRDNINTHTHTHKHTPHHCRGGHHGLLAYGGYLFIIQWQQIFSDIYKPIIMEDMRALPEVLANSLTAWHRRSYLTISKRSFRDREQIWDTIRMYYETWIVNNIIRHRASLENAMNYLLSHHKKSHT